MVSRSPVTRTRAIWRSSRRTARCRYRPAPKQSQGSAPMLEMMLCSLFTLVPDYLYRRYGQGKRFGDEITIYSVWYELRYGITTCLMLTVLLITAVFYYHPSASNVVGLFRAVPIVPEIN